MKETDFLKIINKTLTHSDLLGDDCALLGDENLFVTQDTLVEDIHFSLSLTSPYYLGRKAVSVNLSDLAASLAIPKYIMVSISAPADIENSFITELYKGINDVCTEYEAKVAGGDITGSQKLVISITAIGKKDSKYITSRKFAKDGDIIITTGPHGSSACALYCLQNRLEFSEELKMTHINPRPCLKQAEILRKNLNENISLMDSSDGLADALFKISAESCVNLEVDFNKIIFNNEIKKIAEKNGLDYKDWIFWGGEDYQLVGTISQDVFEKLPNDCFTKIGHVCGKHHKPFVKISYDDFEEKITDETFNTKSFNHFEVNNEN